MDEIDSEDQFDLSYNNFPVVSKRRQRELDDFGGVNLGVNGGRREHNRRLSLPVSVARSAVHLPSPLFRNKQSLSDAMRKRNNVEWSKDYDKLPDEPLAPLTPQITAAITGPKEGIRGVQLANIKPTLLCHPRFEGRVKCFNGWTERAARAFGTATSLYEKNPCSQITEGEPVADVFAMIARENSCVLSIADGVNWGEKSQLAARCAVAGSIHYINQYLCSAVSTHDVMELLCKSFVLAQECIVENNATMTTLCTAVICPIKGSDRWAVCVMNVGDSLGFVYTRETATQQARTREITIGSHCSESKRDMRCPGGSLGPVDGYNPDLTNLTFSYTIVSSGDIVFLTSDGVSDNFDPVVSQCRHCQGELKHSSSMDSLTSAATNDSKNDGSYLYNEWDAPATRHNKTLSDMQEAIELEVPDENLSARTLCANLIGKVAKCTQKKRDAVEKKLQEGQVREIAKASTNVKNDIRRIMKELPGKLDHASIVAFEVGHFPQEHLRVVSEGTNKSRNIFDNLKGMFHGLTGSQSESNGRDQLVNLLSPT